MPCLNFKNELMTHSCWWVDDWTLAIIGLFFFVCVFVLNKDVRSVYLWMRIVVPMLCFLPGLNPDLTSNLFLSCNSVVLVHQHSLRIYILIFQLYNQYPQFSPQSQKGQNVWAKPLGQVLFPNVANECSSCIPHHEAVLSSEGIEQFWIAHTKEWALGEKVKHCGWPKWTYLRSWV